MVLVLAGTGQISSVAAQGTSSCPGPVQGEILKQPREIPAEKGILDTQLVVRVRERQCIPVWTRDSNGNFTWVWGSFKLRTYGWPKDRRKPIDPNNPNDPNTEWDSPAPTFRVRKASARGASDGTKIRLKLYNRLDPNPYPGQCNPPCPDNVRCTGSKNDPACCKVKEKFPNCFHEDNTTNLHYHGFHVSPQPPQDFVLLSLVPPGSPASAGQGHGGHGTTVVGEYQFELDPLTWYQAEGTHWYHPHKHGSTAIQVFNGMAGTFIIEGPFDDWLNGFYRSSGQKLEEKVLVLQNIGPDLNFLAKDPNFVPAPIPLVNGQANPKIIMKRGEIQRWRFIGATMHALAQLNIRLDEGPDDFQVRQIAMDGVQFSPENYASQPLLWEGIDQFQLAPGNRADFLIRAPDRPGTHFVTYDIFAVLEEELEGRAMAQFRPMAAKLGTGTTNPPLLTIVVTDDAMPMEFPPPEKWPPLPDFLRNIDRREVRRDRTVGFEMKGAAGTGPTFYIGGRQYDPSCANLTMDVTSAEEWTITNQWDQPGKASPRHPFHIHINPFQLMEAGVIIDGQQVPLREFPSPVWQDTVALPPMNASCDSVSGRASWDILAGPIFSQQEAEKRCPTVCRTAGKGGVWNGNWLTIRPNEMSVCGCCYAGPGYVKIRQRFDDFTGEYVIHCHFLGHEDRGMMLNVQTICPNQPGKFFGKPRPNQPECVPGNLIPAASPCK